jgi:hypothetical protein
MGRTFLPRAYRELLAMSQLVTDSPLDWTIARFTRPTDGARTGTVRAGYLGRDHIRASITRADIATFLLAQSTDPRFHRARHQQLRDRSLSYHRASNNSVKRKSNFLEPPNPELRRTPRSSLEGGR